MIFMSVLVHWSLISACWCCLAAGCLTTVPPGRLELLRPLLLVYHQVLTVGGPSQYVTSSNVLLMIHNKEALLNPEKLRLRNSLNVSFPAQCRPRVLPATQEEKCRWDTAGGTLARNSPGLAGTLPTGLMRELGAGSSRDYIV